MTIGIAGASSASPRDNGLKVTSQHGNTQTDEAASRRAGKQADAERAEVKANQVTKEVLGIKTVAENALDSSGSIDIYA